MYPYRAAMTLDERHRLEIEQGVRPAPEATRATLAQPVADDDIRRPEEVRLLISQLAAAGLELRQLRTGEQPTSSQLRRAVGIAGSYHVGLAEVRGQKQCPGGRWPHCEGQIE